MMAHEPRRTHKKKLHLTDHCATPQPGTLSGVTTGSRRSHSTKSAGYSKCSKTGRPSYAFTTSVLVIGHRADLTLTSSTAVTTSP